MSRWWAGLAPAEAAIPCGGQRHRLRWEAGELTAVDHGDPEQEATLAALAGESYPCLELLRAWSRRRDDPRVLTLGSRGPTDPLAIDLDSHPHPHWRGRPRRRTDEQVQRLLATGGGLPERLQATAIATWARRLRTGHAALEATRPELVAALYGRALRTLRVWLGESELSIALTMIEPGTQPRIARTADGLEVELAFGWLSDVWARGLAVIWGRLCLDAQTLDGSRWTLTTLGPDLRDRAELTITIR